MTRPTTLGLIEAVRRGKPSARDEFALLYQDAVRAYVRERWRGRPLASDTDDAVQDVFVECLRAGGALERFDGERAGGFRAFLFGVALNVCLRIEERATQRLAACPAPGDSALADVESQVDRASVAFDRTWARSLVHAAAELQEARARLLGPAALRRVEVLRLRFRENLPICEIAARLGEDAAILHHEYARARDEFRESLIEVVQLRQPGSRAHAEAECAELLKLLG